MGLDEDLRDAPPGTLGESLRAAEAAGPMRDPNALDMGPHRVAAVVAAFRRHLNGPAGNVLMPWTGLAELPDVGRSWTVPANALLPPESGHMDPPWPALHRSIGPLWPDRLTVLVGAPGRGKSAFAVQVAERVARAGHPVLYASAEMGPDDLVARLLALRARGTGDDDGWGIAYSAVRRGRAPAGDVEAAGGALVHDCPALYLWAPEAADRTGKRLQAAAMAVSGLHGGAPPLVVVDYVQRFAPSDADGKREAVSGLSGELRDLSRPGGLGQDWPGAAVLALSSAPRSGYTTTAKYVPPLANCKALREAHRAGDALALGKESGELEYDAPLVLCLTTDRATGDDPDPRPAVLAVVKNREGPEPLVEMHFAPACGRFSEPPAAETGAPPGLGARRR